MKEQYNHEFTGFIYWLSRITGMWRINKESIDFKWGYFAPRWGLTLMLNRGGYFDTRYSIDICLLWGYFSIKLPFNTRLGEGCDMPQYGFTYFTEEHSLMCYWGGHFDKDWGQVTQPRMFIWRLPFVTWEFENKFPMENFSGDYKFNYYDAECEVIATVTVSAMVWHRKWAKWSKKKAINYNIQFDTEMGDGRGSWKGGTLGVSMTKEQTEPSDPMKVLQHWLIQEGCSIGDIDYHYG